MEQSKKRFYLSGEARSKADETANRLCRRWQLLCERFLPVQFEDSIWRISRDSTLKEPLQGWKLHLSATIFEACDLFERVAPFLISEDVQFKAPKCLEKLSSLNCGLQYGYWQVGKFITVYPSTEKQAVELAGQLHELTKDFFTISVPFDEQYLPESSVFYRYGAFSKIEKTDENGKVFLAIQNSAEEFVVDDRLQAVPEWISDPFPKNGSAGGKTFADTPLGIAYKVFRAIKQRGKGGTYQAVDFSQNTPRFCVVKEGRQNGELGWNGQDGYFLVQNEFEVLKVLKEKYDAVPQVFASFEIFGNFYFVMEYVEGKSLYEIMQTRRRRFSIGKVLELAAEIAKIIENIHRAGWVWNDCKPPNLIVTPDNSLRPIDFEGAYRANQPEPFDWKSKSFSSPSQNVGKAADIYALGAVIYFLLTGIFYDAENQKGIDKLRRNVPQKLIEITGKMLSAPDFDISEARKEFKKIADSI
ncbi:MAG: AarF/UbiB family protein [Pyrinomonadaceae bacterium]